MSGMTGPASWPFVGRERLIADVLGHARDDRCGGVLLTGEAGVGKTRLADEVLSLLRADGHPTLRAVATPAARTTPFGAVAHAIPRDALDGARQVDPMRIFLALRGEQVDHARTAVMVDDVPFLDDATFTLVSQLLSGGHVFVIATARAGTPLPPAADSMVRAFGMRRIEVDDLTPAEVERTVEQVLGCPVDPASAAELWDVTEGNALYVRELLLGAMEAGAVERSSGTFARLAEDAWTTRRLVEFVGERLESIAANHADTLSLIAIAEPLLLSDLERESLLDDATELERLGVVQVDDSGQEPVIRLSHPLHGEVLRSRLGALARRRQVLRAIGILGSRPAPRPDDPLRIASWRLDVGQSAEPAVLLAGARLARSAMDYPSTIRLARAAYERERTAAAQHLLTEALFISGEAAQAEAVAAEPPPDDIDPFTSMLLVAARVNNLLWGVNDPEQALEVVATHREAFAANGMAQLLTIIEANVHAFDGRPALALEILGDFGGSTDSLILGATAGITALTLQGRFDRAIELSRRAYEVHMRMPNPKSLLDPGNHLLTLGVALLDRGDVAEAARVCTAAHAEALRDRVTFMRAWHALVVAKADLVRGDLDGARAWFTDSLAAAEEIRLRPARRLALAGLAATAGQQGDAVTCAPLLVDLASLPADLSYMEGDVPIGTAWALTAVGRPAEARAVLRASLDEAVAAGDSLRIVETATEAARLGDADGVRKVMEAEAAKLDGPRAAAMCRFVVARSTDDPAELRAAEEALDALGAHLLAAEAGAALATRLRRDGLARDAAAAAARSQAALARCRGATTPGLLVAESVVPLSRREREIAQLAATGLASREIAERLFLSVRTVSNHLQNIYTKLGVASRAELAESIGRG